MEKGYVCKWADAGWRPNGVNLMNGRPAVLTREETGETFTAIRPKFYLSPAERTRLVNKGRDRIYNRIKEIAKEFEASDD